MLDKIDVKGDGRVILYLRRDGRSPLYQVKIKVPGSNGYKRVSTKTSNQREAERFALDLYEELYFHVKSGGTLTSKSYKQVFKEWRLSIEVEPNPEIKARLLGILSRVETYSVDYFGTKDIRSINKKEFSEYWVWRKTNYKRVAPSNGTLNRERTSIISLFKFAVDRGYITTLPNIPKNEVKGIARRSTFTNDEWRKITRNMREWVKAGHKNGKRRERFILQQYVLILANTGMRIGEIRHLRWSDLRTVKTLDGRRLIGDVSGKTGRREVVFQKGSEEYIKRLFDFRKEELRSNPPQDELVFLSRKSGKAYTTFKTSFNSMLRFAGIEVERNGERRTIYSLRHFYATQRLSEGTSAYLLAQQMGTSVEMLEKFYGHVVTADVAEQISKSNRQKSKETEDAYPFEV